MPGIKTAFRCKTGAHLVYPIRLGSIQRCIEPAHTLFDIAVEFFDYRAPKQGEFRTSYPIAEIRFRPESPSERKITLHPVPKSLYPEINETMKKLFSENVAPWLMKKQTAGWAQRFHALHVSYDSTEKSFVISGRDGA